VGAFRLLDGDDLLMWSSTIRVGVFDGEAASRLFLLKTRSETMCSSSSDGVGVTLIGAYLFLAEESLIKLVGALIFLIRSAIFDMPMSNNILSAKENK